MPKKKARTGTDHALNGLECHRPELIHARVCTCTHHGVLAADLIARQGVVWSELCRVRDDVEVRQGRLDHNDVGAFHSVTLLENERNTNVVE